MALLERRGTILIAGLFALSMGLGACGDETGGSKDFVTGAAGSISVTPSPLSLEQVSIGSELPKSLTIMNTAPGTLRITEIILHEEAGGQFDPHEEFFEVGDGWVSHEIVLEQGDQHIIDMAYRPLDQRSDQGSIIIRSNDPQRKELIVPIITQGLSPEIFSPPTVQFPRVVPVTPAEGEPAWEGVWQTTQVQNTGAAPLVINNISIEGSDRFRFTIPQPTEEEIAGGLPPDPANDTMAWPETLAPDEKFEVRVWFTPDSNNPEEGQLVFESNDTNSPIYTVELIGNSGAPCINVSPNDEVSFAQGSIGLVSQKTVTIENCSSNSDLKISDIRIANDGGGVFAIQSGSLPGGLPDEDFILEHGDITNVVVTFSPIAEESYEGELIIESNDPATPQRTLAINGRGTDNACPTAVATATIQGNSSSRPSTMIQALPLDTIQFDASASSDPDGTIARYEWTLLSSPRDSTELIRPQGSANPTLFLDMAGEYKVELKVYDDQNTVSCGEPAILTILSQSEEDILVQLAWDTPADSTETDSSGSDVDLHYLHPNAEAWGRSPWDTYYGNKTPDWAVPGDSYDDPTLDIDDVTGWGPENVSHSGLENVQYKVGVHYYSDHGYGPSYVTIRIFKNGIEAFTIEDKFMTDDQFWDVARINGRTLAITPIDVINNNGYP